MTNSPSRPPSSAVIHAAGGIVWRDAARTAVAVIRRGRYGEEWTLPKGKVDEAETWEQAAVREVEEETGCRVQLESFAGGQIYQVGDRPKVVLYWHMRVETEGVARPDDEVRELLWLTPTAAQARLTHESARRLVAEAAAAHAPEPTGRRARIATWWRGLWASSPRERLSDTLPTYRRDVTFLIASTERGDERAAWATEAERLLDEAALSVRDDNGDRGWRQFHAAQRFELHGLRRLGPPAFRARALTIRAEARQKLRSWRRLHVEELFASVPKPDPGAAISDAELWVAHEALGILHEHFANEALKQRAARVQARLLVMIALGALALWLSVAGPGIFLIAEVPDRFPWYDPRLVVSALIFGIMGAAFSALTSLASQPTAQTIPEQVFTYRVTLARQVVGMLSALVVYALLASRLLQIGGLSVTTPLVLVAAFAAGFSERLVVRALERIAVASDRGAATPAGAK